MKKILLSVALISTMVMAGDYNDEYNYEVTPVIGYNFADSDSGLDDSTLYGAEFQYNDVEYMFKPELSLLYSNTDYTNSILDTSIYKMALNGVYEYEKMGIFTPIGKVGVGYENIDFVNINKNSHDGAFLDAGIGAKIDLAKDLALKLEAIYMLKDGVDGTDSNFATLAGINYSFGKKAQPEPVKPVDGDDDNDGVLNSVDACPTTPAGTQVDASGCKIDGDDDNDGVLNSIDTCPTTPAGTQVDASGCKIDGDDDNDGVLNSVDACPTTPADTKVDASGCKIDGDDDNDGVLNSIDTCPTTPAGKTVDTDGCMLPINLQINFKTNSFDVDNSSDMNLEEFAQYLKVQSNYNAKIIGHTDSRGSKAYNTKLSVKRADAVKDILVEKGVDADRIATVGMGEDEPIATNKTRDGRAQNRRIEATLHKN